MWPKCHDVVYQIAPPMAQQRRAFHDPDHPVDCAFPIRPQRAHIPQPCQHFRSTSVEPLYPWQNRLSCIRQCDQRMQQVYEKHFRLSVPRWRGIKGVEQFRLRLAGVRSEYFQDRFQTFLRLLDLIRAPATRATSNDKTGLFQVIGTYLKRPSALAGKGLFPYRPASIAESSARASRRTSCRMPAHDRDVGSSLRFRQT